VALHGIREHVTKSLMNLRETLTAGDISRAKDALARHIGKLVLTPIIRDGRPHYQVSGNLTAVPDAEKCRMQLVARDGYPQHSTLLSIPLTDVYLDPRVDVR
jgi:hypothetical protein